MKLIIGIMIAGALLACEQTATQAQKQIPPPSTTTQEPNKEAIPKEAIAKVGDHFFVEADIDAEFLHMPDSVKKMQQQKAMRTNLLKNIMTRYALVEQAKAQGVDTDPQVKAQIESMSASILIQALSKKVRKQLAPSEDDVRQYYAAHQQQYQQNNTAAVRDFDDVKVQITTQLQQQRFHDWVEQMKKNATYEILDAKYRLPDVRSPISKQ
ncbi:MAG: hypothetical protein Q9M22_02845 [Mariprofundaceae bacterium]|nr:hypothetical protein [Mariprofundaceae bacterium]